MPAWRAIRGPSGPSSVNIGTQPSSRSGASSSSRDFTNLLRTERRGGCWLVGGTGIADAARFPPVAGSIRGRNGATGWVVGPAAAAPLIIGIFGFIPAYVVAAQGKGWWYNAFTFAEAPWVIAAKERLGLLWDGAELMHALTAPIWVGLALHQVYTGATGQPGDERKVRVRHARAFACAARDCGPRHASHRSSALSLA